MESSKIGADSILMSGYLSKRPRNLRRGSVGSGGMTKKRFLVLSEGSLEWRESDKSTVAKNSMPITAATTVELTLDRPSKTLVVNGELTLIGQPEELRAWAEAIQAHVATKAGMNGKPSGVGMRRSTGSSLSSERGFGVQAAADMSVASSSELSGS